MSGYEPHFLYHTRTANVWALFTVAFMALPSKQTDTESLFVKHYTLLNASVYHPTPVKTDPFSWLNHSFIPCWLIHMPY